MAGASTRLPLTSAWPSDREKALVSTWSVPSLCLQVVGEQHPTYPAQRYGDGKGQQVEERDEEVADDDAQGVDDRKLEHHARITYPVTQHKVLDT